MFGQALRLAKAKRPTALLLEGTRGDLAGSGMRWEAVQDALITVALFIGLPVLRSRSPEKTNALRLRLVQWDGCLSGRANC